MVKASQTNQDQTINALRDTIVAMVRRDGPDLSARQLAVFLTCYLTNDEQTVRGLAAELNVSKPAITRALDRLQALFLVRRVQDQMDRRSVLIRYTPKGKAYLRELYKIVTETATAIQEKEAAPARRPQRVRGVEELRRAG